MDIMFVDYLVSWDGQKCKLSGDWYELTEDTETTYKKGDRVKLIGGADGHFDEPGYHFSPGWVTVSKVCHPANFIGVKKSQIRKVGKNC